MLRQVIVPSKENSVISIPSEFYGTKVEVLVFPFHDPKANQGSESIDEIFDRHLYPFQDYKFDRNEANDYE